MDTLIGSGEHQALLFEPDCPDAEAIRDEIAAGLAEIAHRIATVVHDHEHKKAFEIVRADEETDESPAELDERLTQMMEYELQARRELGLRLPELPDEGGPTGAE